MLTFGVSQRLGKFQESYRVGKPISCPGCGNSHWNVGRFSAECCYCSTPVPFQFDSTTGMGTRRQTTTTDLSA